MRWFDVARKVRLREGVPLDGAPAISVLQAGTCGIGHHRRRGPRGARVQIVVSYDVVPYRDKTKAVRLQIVDAAAYAQLVLENQGRTLSVRDAAVELGRLRAIPLPARAARIRPGGVWGAPRHNLLPSGSAADFGGLRAVSASSRHLAPPLSTLSSSSSSFANGSSHQWKSSSATASKARLARTAAGRLFCASKPRRSSSVASPSPRASSVNILTADGRPSATSSPPSSLASSSGSSKKCRWRGGARARGVGARFRRLSANS